MASKLSCVTTICLALFAFVAGADAFALKESDEYALYGGKVPTIAVPTTSLGPALAPLECGAPGNFLSGTFTGWDYSIVLGMLIISIGIGIFYGFFDKASANSEDFLRGSGMQLFPVSLSLTTSFITAIELLGNPSEMFFNGTQYSLIVISMAAVIPLAVKVFYPIYFKLDLTSCYEYLGIRFGNSIRVFGAILYIVQMCFYTAVSVYAPAIALSKATSLDTHLAVVLIYVVVVFYSSQGGMKAVVIADTFQTCVLALSLVAVVALGYIYTGTFAEVMETAYQHERIEFFNIDPSPTQRHSVFSVVIGGFFYWASLLCTNQASVQKCMSLKSPHKANLALIYSTIGLVTVFFFNFYTGLMVFREYANCDPLKTGQIVEHDGLLPFYIMDVFGNVPALNGLFVAGIFAASLGTVAAALNSLSAVASEDIITTGLNIKISAENGSRYIKWMSLGFGIISLALVFVVEQLGGVLQATLTLNGLIGGVTLGLFSLGIFFKSANAKGALYGGLLALVLVVYLGIMSQIKGVAVEPLPTLMEKCSCFVNETMLVSEKLQDEVPEIVSPFFRISYMWYSFMGTALTVLFGLLFSFITDCIETNAINDLNSANSLPDAEKPASPAITKGNHKDTEPVFIVERRHQQRDGKTLKGYDNAAMDSLAN